MRYSILRGTGLLALLWGLSAAEAGAQYVNPGAPAARTVVSANPPSPPMVRPVPGRDFQARPAQAIAYQDPPPAPAPPSSPLGNETDLSIPRAEKDEGGGEATAAEEAKEEEEAPAETTLLMKILGMEDSPVKVYGWIENSFTYNANGTGNSDLNFGVNPNFEANRWMGNQYYLIIENPIEQNDQVNFGFRVDNLFGNDWQFNHMVGMLDNKFKLNHFAGYDPAQMYGEVHLPFLTKGGLDIKGGRFYTILGYEVVPAIGRPLVSVPYMFNYGQPFTHFGALSTLHATDRINVYNGVVNGWDRWINQNFKWSYLGGWSWTSKDTKLNVAMSYIFGPDQYPKYLPNGTQLVLPGATFPPFLAGRKNIGYGGNWRTMFTTVATYTWTDKLTQVMETDEGFESNVPNLGVGGTSRNESWYSFGNWFLYKFTDKLTGIWRSEVFRDNGGARTGFSDNFYEQTVGLVWKPKSWIWFRGEARYDWAQFTHPYTDGTRNNQFTLAGEIIFLF